MESAKLLHAKAKLKEWSAREAKARRLIAGLEEELMAGSMTFSLQQVHACKNSLIAQRQELAKAELWVSHWGYKCQEGG